MEAKIKEKKLKKLKDPKINLEFLKCYWKKNYQQLA